VTPLNTKTPIDLKRRRHNRDDDELIIQNLALSPKVSPSGPIQQKNKNHQHPILDKITPEVTSFTQVNTKKTNMDPPHNSQPISNSPPNNINSKTDSIQINIAKPSETSSGNLEHDFQELEDVAMTSHDNLNPMKVHATMTEGKHEASSNNKEDSSDMII